MSGQAVRGEVALPGSGRSVAASLDWPVLLLYATLVVIGLVMVTSASISIASDQLGDPFFYGKRQVLRILLALLLLTIAYRVPTEFWHRHGMSLMLFALFLLVLVLLPGVGKTVNGATRWIGFSLFTIQVSELAKLFLIIYLSGYLVRRQDEISESSMGFIKPMIILALASGLLLMEPDFGATAVLLMTGLGMMFLGGVRFGQFFVFVLGTLSIMSVLAVTSSYRMARITSFLDPWSDPFHSGFQLTQALIAIGSGGIYGAGLGGSIQKLFYLPEAHTDFLFSVYAEEFGLIGSVFLIALYLMLMWRCFRIARNALFKNQAFGAYLAYGVGLLISLQAIINIGVNMGALPTKGLTLPFISYGGNSILILSFAIGLVLRVHFETSNGDSESVKSSIKSRKGVKSRQKPVEEAGT